MSFKLIDELREMDKKTTATQENIRKRFYHALREDDIVTIRNGFTRGEFEPDMRRDFWLSETRLIFHTASIEAFNLFIEFGFKISEIKDTSHFIGEMLCIGHSPLTPPPARYLWLMKFNEHIISQFDQQTIAKYVNDSHHYTKPPELQSILLKHCAGRFIRTSQRWILNSSGFDHQTYLVEDNNGDEVITYTTGSGGSYRKLRVDHQKSYTNKICAIVMFGAKIKTGKRELCRLLHTFLV